MIKQLLNLKNREQYNYYDHVIVVDEQSIQQLKDDAEYYRDAYERIIYKRVQSGSDEDYLNSMLYEGVDGTLPLHYRHPATEIDLALSDFGIDLALRNVSDDNRLLMNLGMSLRSAIDGGSWWLYGDCLYEGHGSNISPLAEGSHKYERVC